MPGRVHSALQLQRKSKELTKRPPYLSLFTFHLSHGFRPTGLQSGSTSLPGAHIVTPMLTRVRKPHPHRYAKRCGWVLALVFLIAISFVASLNNTVPTRPHTSLSLAI